MHVVRAVKPSTIFNSIISLSKCFLKHFSLTWLFHFWNVRLLDAKYKLIRALKCTIKNPESISKSEKSSRQDDCKYRTEGMFLSLHFEVSTVWELLLSLWRLNRDVLELSGYEGTDCKTEACVSSQRVTERCLLWKLHWHCQWLRWVAKCIKQWGLGAKQLLWMTWLNVSGQINESVVFGPWSSDSSFSSHTELLWDLKKASPP